MISLEAVKQRVMRRLFPLLAAIGLIAWGMASTTLGPKLMGKPNWALPNDIFGTLIAASRLAHLNLGGLYTQPTGLIAFPGTAIILIPAAVVSGLAGFPLHPQDATHLHPMAWLIAGPYEIAISSLALFAVDHLAERLGASRPQRFFVAAAGAVALWSVAIRWGHPEDAVAVGLLLYAIADLDARPRRAGWLAGAAIAVQPLVLLALPVACAAVMAGTFPVLRAAADLARFLVRAAVPGLVTLGAAAAANWSATVSAVTSQPNSPVIDHPTPWTSLAPHMADGNVAAGPGRLLAIACAALCAAGLWWRLARLPRGDGRDRLAEVLWWAGIALALRCVFESVMVCYYIWPALAVALAVAAPSWFRLVPVGVAVVTLTFLSQWSWRSPWGWWSLMVGGLALTLWLARATTLYGRDGTIVTVSAT
jgi:hypothetical protein